MATESDEPTVETTHYANGVVKHRGAQLDGEMHGPWEFYRMSRLLEPMTDIPVDAAIAERAGRLRRGMARRLPDALIAATALEHRLTLVTRNVRDFDGIRGLKVRAPS